MTAFESRDHKVIWGDAIEALRSHVPDGSVDLIFADPPYNIGKDFHGHKDKWPYDVPSSVLTIDTFCGQAEGP
jgi:adenine-specific DNA-methyltransferase